MQYDSGANWKNEKINDAIKVVTIKIKNTILVCMPDLLFSNENPIAPINPTSITNPPTQDRSHFCILSIPKIQSHQERSPTITVANKILIQFTFIPNCLKVIIY